MNRHVTDDGLLIASNTAGSRYAHGGWERVADPSCHMCGSEHVAVDLSGSMLVFACKECENWEERASGEVMCMYNSGEPFFSEPDCFDLDVR